MKKRSMFAGVLALILLVTGIGNPAVYFSDTVKANGTTGWVTSGTIPELYTQETADVLIKSAAEFFTFAKNVTNGDTYEGKVVKLCVDLDMSPYEFFNGVGGMNTKTAFRGVFDGGGHTIYNANVVTDGRYYIGLFNYVYEGTVKNLNVVNLSVDGQSDDVSSKTGGIVGYLEDAVVSNCTFQGNIIGTNYVGGIAGESSSSIIRNCGILNSKISGKIHVGGICGRTYSTCMENSFFDGEVIGTRYEIGGLVGAGTVHLKNCYVIPKFQNISKDVTKIGLIIGNSDAKGSASACYYLQDDKWSVMGDTSNTNYKTTAYTDEQLKSEDFVRKLNANKISYSADTWTGWVKGENGYPRLAKLKQVYFTKEKGVILQDYNMYGEEGQTYSITLKKGTGISEIIPSVHLKSSGAEIKSTYSNGVLKFVMPNESVYMNFTVIEAPPTEKPTAVPTTIPTPTMIPTIVPTTTPIKTPGVYQVIYKNVNGITFENKTTSCEEGRFYSVILKKEQGISEVIPHVYLKDGTKITSYYSNDILSFMMPGSNVYIDFVTIAATPTVLPSITPTVIPSSTPTLVQTENPAEIPGAAPTAEPSMLPGSIQTEIPPTDTLIIPSTIPTAAANESTTVPNTTVPDTTPSLTPTAVPSLTPSTVPSVTPSAAPSVNPSVTPVITVTPSIVPSTVPEPTAIVTMKPTTAPTVIPTQPTVNTTPEKVTLYVGGNVGYSIKLVSSYEDGDKYDLTYSSSDEKVASVTQTGIVTAKKAGKAVIFAKLTSKSDPKLSYSLVASTITVKKAGITFKKPIKVLKVKQKEKLQLNLKGVKGTVKWSISNKRIATISKTGTITAKKAGTVKITASCGKKKATMTVKIKK